MNKIGVNLNFYRCFVHKTIIYSLESRYLTVWIHKVNIFALSYYFLVVFPVGKLYSRWKSKTVFRPFNEIKEKNDHKLFRKYSAVFPSEWSACLLTRLEISAYMLKLIFTFRYSVESFHFRRHQHSVDNSMVLIELNTSWHWRVNESVDYCKGKFHSKIYFH